MNLCAENHSVSAPALIQAPFSLHMALGSSDLLHILSPGLLNTPANICQTKAVQCFLYPCQCLTVCFSIFFISTSITTHSSNSLFISFFLTLIFPSLLCPILIWLSRLLRAPLFLSPTSSPAIAIPILNFLDKQSSITKGHNWSTFSKENTSFF